MYSTDKKLNAETYTQHHMFHGSDIEIQTDAMLQMDGHHLETNSNMFSDPAPVPSIEQFSLFQQLAEFERKINKVFKK